MGNAKQVSWPDRWSDLEGGRARARRRGLGLREFGPPLFKVMTVLEHLTGRLRAVDAKLGEVAGAEGSARLSDWRVQARQLVLFMSVFLCFGTNMSWTDLPGDMGDVVYRVSMIDNQRAAIDHETIDREDARRIAEKAANNFASVRHLIIAGMTVGAERAKADPGSADSAEILRWMRAAAADIKTAQPPVDELMALFRDGQRAH